MKDLNPSLDENTGPTLAPPGGLGVHQTRPTTRRISGSCLLSSFPSKSPIASNPPVSVPYSRCSCSVRALTEPKLFRNPRCWLHTEGQRDPRVHSHLIFSRFKSRLQLRIYEIMILQHQILHGVLFPRRGKESSEIKRLIPEDQRLAPAPVFSLRSQV